MNVLSQMEESKYLQFVLTFERESLRKQLCKLKKKQINYLANPYYIMARILFRKHEGLLDLN